MRTIWKFDLQVSDKVTIEMPKGAVILSIQVQHGIAKMWAEVITDMPKVKRTFETIGTGREIAPGPMTYIGTYMIYDGSLVYHVYERIN